MASLHPPPQLMAAENESSSHVCHVSDAFRTAWERAAGAISFVGGSKLKGKPKQDERDQNPKSYCMSHSMLLRFSM